MRELRNLLYFLLGVFLVSLPILSYAETTLPVRKTYWKMAYYPYTGATSEDACRSFVASNVNYRYHSVSAGGITCNYYDSPSAQYSTNTPITYYDFYECPDPVSTWTLTNGVCTRPDCPPDKPRNPATGLCEAPLCNLPANATIGDTRYKLPWPQPSGVIWCVQGCTAYPIPPFNVDGNTAYARMAVNGAGGSASTCTGSTTTPDTVPNATTTADPPCNPGDGVLAIGNTVKCVPSNTPGATTPPKVTTQQNQQKFPDGSTSTTIITQTCTGEGACTSTTTTNITPAASGGAGQAGTPGTTTGKSDKPSADQPGFCAQNPNLQICKGNMAEEATQIQVLDTAKKTLEQLEMITKPTVTDDSSLTEKGQFKESDELKTADKDASDRATGSIDPISAPKGAWESAMSSGFWSPIPQSGCSPHSSKIGPFQWSFDLCPIASKISDIGAYALWFILAISTFVMLTGGRKT